MEQKNGKSLFHHYYILILSMFYLSWKLNFSLYFFKFNYFIRCLILFIFCIKISECCWNGGCGYLWYNLLMDWQCVPMNAHVIQISRVDYKSSAVSSTFIAIKLNRKIFFPRSQTNWFFLYLFLAWLSIPIF